MSAFVVFSMMGFYPVTPGIPTYDVGSPVLDKVTIHLKMEAIFPSLLTIIPMTKSMSSVSV